MEPHWLQHRPLPGYLATWLRDQGSLTQRLKKKCAPRLKIELLQQAWQSVPVAEQTLLKLKPRQLCLSRQSLLYCQDQPVIFALSHIPYHALQGKGRCLYRLGEKPLGEVLFQRPKAQKKWIEIARLQAPHLLYQLAIPHCDHSPKNLWARRNYFIYLGQPILVHEVFLADQLLLGSTKTK